MCIRFLLRSSYLSAALLQDGLSTPQEEPARPSSWDGHRTVVGERVFVSWKEGDWQLVKPSLFLNSHVCENSIEVK